jgi:hypothetical protein
MPSHQNGIHGCSLLRRTKQPEDNGHEWDASEVPVVKRSEGEGVVVVHTWLCMRACVRACAGVRTGSDAVVEGRVFRVRRRWHIHGRRASRERREAGVARGETALHEAWTEDEAPSALTTALPVL